MPSKTKTSITNYLSDKKYKLAEYQRREGTNSLSNDNFVFTVHSVSVMSLLLLLYNGVSLDILWRQGGFSYSYTWSDQSL